MFGCCTRRVRSLVWPPGIFYIVMQYDLSCLPCYYCIIDFNKFICLYYSLLIYYIEFEAGLRSRVMSYHTQFQNYYAESLYPFWLKWVKMLVLGGRVHNIRVKLEFQSALLTVLSQDIADYKNIKKTKFFKYPALRNWHFKKWT